MKTLNIFISSSLKDCEGELSAVKRAIIQLGHKPMMAEDIFTSKYKPEIGIKEAIMKSDVVVVILGSRYSKWVDKELKWAIENKKPLLTYVTSVITSTKEVEKYKVPYKKYENNIDLWKKILFDVNSLIEEKKKIEERFEKKKVFKASLHNQTPPEPNFVGRTEMLETITEWYKNPEVQIGAFIGWGGVGKSALVRKWYDSLEANKIRPDGIFWWGFYRNAYLEQFLNALLRYVSGGQIEPENIRGTWEKVDRIKEYIGRGEYLIILDGLEEMQKGQTSGEEFGCMEHREFAEMLKYLADTKGNGLCLITTRYPLTDIKHYEGTVYQKVEVERLSIEDGRNLFEKIGVKGKQEEIDSVIKEYDGHALSLTLLAGYLVEDFGGDITKAKEIPPFYSDKEAGGKAHRIFLWYAKQLNEEQSAFMKIFSLFRRAVREEDFDGVFRAEMQTQMNQALREMNEFAFKRMVDNLVDRRLISKDKDGTYATHPLIKNYFDSIFEKEDKRLCHKQIYHYIGGYAPERPETLDEMQPLFEQVYHGCAAGLYDEVFDDVYYERVNRGREGFLVYKLGAWETVLSLAKTFFPEGDLSQIPLVGKRSAQSWLLNTAGLALLSTGRAKEAEELFLAGLQMDIEAEDWENASVGYQNLAELQFQTGELESGLDSAQKALDLAEKARSDEYILYSNAYLAHLLHLLGNTKETERWFRKADELERKVSEVWLYSKRGTFYADFLISINEIDQAFELTQENIKICQSQNWLNDICRCLRLLGAIERIKGDKRQAEEHLQDALEIAREVGQPALEIEALLERGSLCLDMKKYEDAISDAEQVLKICGRTGFRLYEPDAEIVLAKAFLAQKEVGKSETNAKSAYEKASGMKYRWAEGDAAHLLGEIALAREDKKEAQQWLKRAIKCRKEILDPKVKESEAILERL